jgi:mRNA interferase MazF
MRRRSVICNQWDVVLVPFPFMEIPVSKKRPALVISSKAFNERNAHSIFAMITTAKASSWPSDYLLSDPKAAELTQNCYVRWKTFTLPNALIIRHIGTLVREDQQVIEAQMGTIFGCS